MTPIYTEEHLKTTRFLSLVQGYGFGFATALVVLALIGYYLT